MFVNTIYIYSKLYAYILCNCKPKYFSLDRHVDAQSDK